jgi:hypothetical protein
LWEREEGMEERIWTGSTRSSLWRIERSIIVRKWPSNEEGDAWCSGANLTEDNCERD